MADEEGLHAALNKVIEGMADELSQHEMGHRAAFRLAHIQWCVQGAWAAALGSERTLDDIARAASTTALAAMVGDMHDIRVAKLDRASLAR